MSTLGRYTPMSFYNFARTPAQIVRDRVRDGRIFSRREMPSGSRAEFSISFSSERLMRTYTRMMMSSCLSYLAKNFYMYIYIYMYRCFYLHMLSILIYLNNLTCIIVSDVLCGGAFMVTHCCSLPPSRLLEERNSMGFGVSMWF